MPMRQVNSAAKSRLVAPKDGKLPEEKGSGQQHGILQTYY